MFRTVGRDAAGHPALRVNAFHAHSFLELSEASGEPLGSTEGGIGWYCIDRRVLVEFTRPHRGFTRLFRDCQEYTKRGVCLPVVLPFRDAPMIGVLSIEVADIRSCSEDQLAFAIAGANQIACAAMDESERDSTPIIERAGWNPAQTFVQMLSSSLVSSLDAQFLEDIESIRSIQGCSIDKKIKVEAHKRSECDDCRDEWKAWQFGAVIFGKNTDNSDHALAERILDPLLDSDEFDPILHQVHFVDRQSSEEWAFGRIPASIQEELRILSDLHVRMGMQSEYAGGRCQSCLDYVVSIAVMDRGWASGLAGRSSCASSREMRVH